MIAKELIKSAETGALRGALVEIQIELLRRRVGTESLVLDHARAGMAFHGLQPQLAKAVPQPEVSYCSRRMEELDEQHRQRAAGIKVNYEELRRQLATAGLKVSHYLLEAAHIESCPVIGRRAHE